VTINNKHRPGTLFLILFVVVVVVVVCFSVSSNNMSLSHTRLGRHRVSSMRATCVAATVAVAATFLFLSCTVSLALADTRDASEVGSSSGDSTALDTTATSTQSLVARLEAMAPAAGASSNVLANSNTVKGIVQELEHRVMGHVQENPAVFEREQSNDERELVVDDTMGVMPSFVEEAAAKPTPITEKDGIELPADGQDENEDEDHENNKDVAGGANNRNAEDDDGDDDNEDDAVNNEGEGRNEEDVQDEKTDGLSHEDLGDSDTTDSVNEFVNRLVHDAKNDHLKAGKATVVQNSNTLNHAASSEPSVAQELRETQEAGVKARQESRQKDASEHARKRKEVTLKRAVRQKREKMRRKEVKMTRENLRKERREERQKSNEGKRKDLMENATKKKMAQKRLRNEGSIKRKKHELLRKKTNERKQKKAMERRNKRQIATMKKRDEQKRKNLAREQLRKANNERATKKRRRLQERAAKVRKRAKELVTKRKLRAARERRVKRRKRATGRHCGCYHQRVNLFQKNKWSLCKPTHLLAGIYRGAAQNLGSIKWFKCCKPCRGSAPLAVGDCRPANWVHSFDKRGWSVCPGESYIQGFYHSSCQKIYCIEHARCCHIKGSAGRAKCKVKRSWISSFDRRGWSLLDNHNFMVGLFRSHKHNLYNIEMADQCQFRAFP
jgi:hypothetical protein